MSAIEFFARGSARAEYLAQQIGDACGGVGADALFLVAHDVKEAVERLADDVSVQVEGLEVEERNAAGLAEQSRIPLGHADLGHRAVDDRGKRPRQPPRALRVEAGG